MTLEEFGRLVQRVLRTLPPEFARYLQHVAVDVEPEPDRKTLRRLGLTAEEIAEGQTVFGQFWTLDGHWGTGGVDPEELPSRIIIYQRPHEESFAGRRQMLIEVRKTVIHELAHHFGYSDEDLERFDNKPDPFGDGWEDEHAAS
jgi:predicted Zn-dependent protease with MMP-like domain